MAKIDPSNLVEAFIGFPEGVNSGMDLLALKTTQCSNAVNLTFRGGIPRTRPSFVEIALTEQIEYTTFQGSAIYSLDSGDQLVCVLDGKIYAIHLDTGISFCLTDIYNLPQLTIPYGRAWFCQAEHFFIIQDGESIPVIIEPGVSPRLSDIANSEVPIGTIMAYGHGRLFLVPQWVGDEDGRRFFLAGDIMWPTQPNKLLKFIETQYLAGGGALSLPSEMGFITGLSFMKNTNTGDGSGALVVFARGGASVFSVNAPRLTWQDIDISQVLFNTGGTVSPDSIIAVNSDLVFRGLDGIRSMMYSVSSAEVLSNVPISGAFGNKLDIDGESDLAYVYAGVWDNYMLMTTHRNGNFWQGMTVIDLAPVTVMGQVMSPTSCGFWTENGLHSLHKARLGAYAGMVMACQFEGHLRLLRADSSQSTSVPSRLYTGSFAFQSPFELKQLLEATISISEVKVASDIELYFRPRGYTKWLLAGSVHIPVASGYARIPLLNIPLQGPFGCDPLTGEDLAVSDDFQFCFIVNGNLKIDKFRARCSLAPHGSRVIEQFTTGDFETFPGVDLESSDFTYPTGE